MRRGRYLPLHAARCAAQIIFKDGAAHYFDSPVNLFNFLNKVPRYDRRYTRDDVATSYVSDLESGQWIEVEHAFFVQGSATVGPMRRPEMPAFASRKAAELFARHYGGTVMRPADVTPTLLQSLGSNASHRH